MKDLNKTCGHNCYRLKEYTCTACAESEKAELTAEIEKLKAENEELKTDKSVLVWLALDRRLQITNTFL